MRASNVLDFLIRLFGSEAFFVHYYRLVYWWIRRSGLGAFNYGYAPLSEPVAQERTSAEPYQMELYNQAALQLGKERLRGQRVLEISCGLGGGLADLTLRYGIGCAVALDRSFIAVSYACRRFGLRAIVGDARRLPFAERSFGAILSVEASHLYFGDEFLAELARVLVPGGDIVMTDRRYVALAEGEQALRSAFTKSGFDVVRFRDVTDNVLAACDADIGRRESLLATVPWPVRSLARQWIGTGKSADYLELLNKRAFYFILTARLRPAAQGEG